jgi:alpha-galactosidase
MAYFQTMTTMGVPLFLLANALGAAATLVDTPTPQMGWNSYNHYNCYPDESIIINNAQGLADYGFADAGYNYVTVDCGWPAPDRDANDRMVWNPRLFPSGVEVIRDKIHGLGLKFGVYSGGGLGQCGNGSLPASLGEPIQHCRFCD